MKSVQWVLSCAMRADGWTVRQELRKITFRILKCKSLFTLVVESDLIFPLRFNINNRVNANY
jgi:hypothetical protein